MTFRLRHLLAALVLHALLFGLLAGGIQCSRKPSRPPVIRAVLLDPDRQQAAQQKKQEQQRRLEERRKAEELRRQQELEKRRLEEEQKKQQLAEQQKRKAAEDAQKKKVEDARRQKELADKKKAEEQARTKKDQEEQRERQDQARREVQEKARMEEEMRQESMRRDLEREQQARAATELEARQAEWIDTLSRHVQKYWNRPASAAGDFECQVHVQLLPDGSVTLAKIAKSCGNSALDRSVEDAVYRATPLPKPRDPSVFDRDLYFTFCPVECS